MAGSARDEIINYVYNVTGDAALAKMSGTLSDLANSSSEVAPEAQKLLDELTALNDQAKNITGFISTTAALADVGSQLTIAVRELDNLSAEFDRADTSSTKVNAAFARADATIASLTARQAALNLELQKQTGALDKAGIDTDHLASATAALGDASALATSRIAGVAAASKEAAAAEEAQSITVGELAEKYGVLASVVENIKTLFATIGAFLALEKAVDEIHDILDTGDKFAKFGIQFANAFGGAEQGQEALANVKELAETVPLSLDDVVTAAINAKKVGLDPLDGTLKTLIDTNAKYGGSIDSLNTLIDDFGKATARGQLSTKLLVTLQQSGVPAAKLLGDAMGKTADQINDLAAKGDLGRDSIDLLLKKLASSAGGDAAKSMGLLGTLVTKVKDEWDEFLELIASSGAYDFVRTKLQGINDALKAGLGDGTLKAKAKAISDGLVAIGNAAAGAFNFLSAHAAAIYDAGKAYALLRVAMLTVDLAGMAKNFALTTVATAENAAATKANALAQEEAAAAAAANAKLQLELAESMQAAGLATAEQTALLEANAAASGGVVAAGYAKLGTVFDGLRAQLNGLSAAAKVGITVAGLDFAYENAKKFDDQLKEINDDQDKNNTGLNFNVDIQGRLLAAAQKVADQAKANEAAEKQRIADQQAAAQKAIAVQEQLKAFADTQIKSSAQLAEANGVEAAEYLAALQAATRYYSALRTQAEALGDSAAVKDATTHLRELAVAQAAATEKNGEIKDSADKVTASIQTLVEQILQFRVQGVAAPIAVEDAFKDIHIDTPGGFKQLTDVLNSVKNISGDTANAIQSQLVEKLKTLDDLDFEKFRQNLVGALNDGKTSADALNIALGAELQAELEKLGFSAQDAGEKYTAAGTKIIAAFGNIAENAKATGTQITQAFEHALNGVSTQSEVNALTAQLKEAFDSGRISAQQYAQSLQAVQIAQDAIKSSSDRAALALTPYQQALKDLGVTSQEVLKQSAKDATDAFNNVIAGSDGSTASIANNSKAFLAMAQAQLAAAASSDDATKQQVANSLLQQSYSFQDSDAVQALIDRYLHLGQVISGLPGGVNSGGGLAPQTKDAQKLTLQLSAADQQLKKVSDEILGASAAWTTYFAQTSTAASKFYDELMTKSFSIQSEVDGGIVTFAERINHSSKEVQDAIDGQRTQLNGLVDALNNIGTAAGGAFANVDLAGGKTLAQLTALDNSLKNGTYDAGLLGSQDLQGLQSAVEAAIQKTQALEDAAKQATAAFESLSAQTQDALDQANGNQQAIEDRRHATALANLKEEAAAAGLLNTQQYQQAVANENALFQLNLKNIQAQADAQKAADKSSGSDSSSGTSSNGSGVTPPTKPTTTGGGAGAALPINNTSITGSPIVLNAVGNFYGAGTKEFDDFSRSVKAAIDKINGRSQ